MTFRFPFPLFSLVVAVLCFGTPTLRGVPQDQKLTLHLDSGYATPFSSTRALFKAADDFDRFNVWLYDLAVENGVHGFWGGFAYYYSMYAAEFTLHEYGHWNRRRAAGAEADFGDRSRYPHLFYLQTLADPGIHTSNWIRRRELFEVDEEADLILDADFFPEQYEHAAGFTHNIKFAGLMADKIYEGRGRAINALGFTHNRLFPYVYVQLWESVEGDATGDHNALSANFKSRGYEISESDIGNAALSAYVLSFSTYRFWSAFFGGLDSGKTLVEPYVWRGLRLPDLEAYYEKGISYRLVTGYYPTTRLRFPVHYEKVVEGFTRQADEIGVGTYFEPDGRTYVEAKLVSGEKLQGKVEVGYEWSRAGTFYGGVDYQDARNLEGLRNVIRLDKGVTSTEFFLGLTLGW